MDNFKLRSISDKENYATYLALPFLELSKFSFGKDNFVNAFVTINGQIGVQVKDENKCGWNFWEHLNYTTDLAYYDNVMILFKCPVQFEQDMVHLLNSKYSQLSAAALTAIESYSGMHFAFRQKDGSIFTTRLVGQALFKDAGYRLMIEKHLDATLPEDAELEPPMRDQDILYDIDTDISFVYEQYQKKGE